MRVNAEILEFLPFWGGGSWWVRATSFRVGTADWSPVHWSRAGDGGADRPWRGGEHTGRRREVGDRNEKQQWGLEQKIRRKEQKFLLGSLGCRTALFCAGRAWLSTLCSCPAGVCKVPSESSCPRAQELLGAQGLAEVGLGVTAVHGQAVLLGFTSACRAVESLCANGTGVNAGSKADTAEFSSQLWAGHCSHRELQTLCPWVFFCKVESTGIPFSGGTRKEH